MKINNTTEEQNELIIHKKLSKEVSQKILKKIFKNLISAIIVMIYFISINIVYEYFSLEQM